MNAVKKNGYALEQLNDQFKSDRDLVLMAVQTNEGAIQYAAPQLLETLTFCKR